MLIALTSMQEAESPPGPWKLIDKPASSHLTLTRTYNNEEIRLEVSANDQVGAAACTRAFSGLRYYGGAAHSLDTR